MEVLARHFPSLGLVLMGTGSCTPTLALVHREGGFVWRVLVRPGDYSKLATVVSTSWPTSCFAEDVERHVLDILMQGGMLERETAGPRWWEVYYAELGPIPPFASASELDMKLGIAGK